LEQATVHLLRIWSTLACDRSDYNRHDDHQRRKQFSTPMIGQAMLPQLHTQSLPPLRPKARGFSSTELYIMVGYGLFAAFLVAAGTLISMVVSIP
jgi:hypothetical protein